MWAKRGLKMNLCLGTCFANCIILVKAGYSRASSVTLPSVFIKKKIKRLLDLCMYSLCEINTSLATNSFMR